LCSALVFGVWQWKARWRWLLSAIMLLLLIASIAATALFASAYTTRFLAYFGGDKLRGKSLPEARQIFLQHVEKYSRPQMYAAALRAWRTKPWTGIGPGMHQNLWPHFAATPDGNPEKGIWPSYPNNHFHSYEVHSDWLQLLEEYGAVGLGLFLAPTLLVSSLLLAGLRRSARRTLEGDYTADASLNHIIIMGALFCAVAMSFHSLGDFNLQMPATTWLLAVVVAGGLSSASRELLPPRVRESR